MLAERHDRRHHPQLRRQRRRDAPQAALPGPRLRPRAARRQGRLWLQYWLFYYYNDFQLLGPLLSGGKHEGDWELVQIRLDAAEQPEQVVFTQHKTAESKAWADVRKAGRTRRWSTSRAARTPTTSARLALDRRVVRPGRRQGPADHADARGRRGHDAAGCCGPAVGRHEGRRARRWTPRARTAPAAARTGSTRRCWHGAPRRTAPPAPAPRRRAATVVVPTRRRRGDRARRRAAPKGSDEPAVPRLPARRAGRGRAPRRRDTTSGQRRGPMASEASSHVTDIASLFVWRRDACVAAITARSTSPTPATSSAIVAELDAAGWWWTSAASASRRRGVHCSPRWLRARGRDRAARARRDACSDLSRTAPAGWMHASEDDASRRPASPCCACPPRSR